MQRDEELARCLWPWLSERLAHVGDDVLALERSLGDGDAGDPYEQVRARTEAFGWILGCVAEGLGGAPSCERRAAAGLAWIVAALSDVARVRGRPLCAVVPEPAPPGVTPAQAWACASTLWRLSESAPARTLRVLPCGDGWAIEDDAGGRWSDRPGELPP